MKMVVNDNTIDSVIFDSYNGCNGLIMVAIAYSSCFFLGQFSGKIPSGVCSTSHENCLKRRKQLSVFR
jgi:hypothetical protein